MHVFTNDFVDLTDTNIAKDYGLGLYRMALSFSNRDMNKNEGKNVQNKGVNLL